MYGLLKEAMTRCAYMNESILTDERGSRYSTWTQGAEFDAAFEITNSLNEAVAMAQGVKGIYRVTVDPSVRMEYHKVFKRLEDGKVFRCESKDDARTPDSASLKMRVFRADEWEVPV